MKLAEEEEEKVETREEEKHTEEKVWPAPPKCVAPPVRTALILPDGVACPDGCERFSSSEDPVIVSKLRYGAAAADFMSQEKMIIGEAELIHSHDFIFIFPQ